MPQNEEKALRMLGFAARARRVTAGASLICAALQKGGAQRPLLVLLAADASENTKKRMTDRTAYYHVPLYTVSADCERLSLRYFRWNYRILPCRPSFLSSLKIR